MIHEASPVAIVVFFVFVGITLGLSFYLGRKAKSSSGYFAAHGQIPWFVNGIAFAGDYLSAASFLGICGMIAFYGYDGFLYSIGFLAGWIVALFVVAEPMKRLGKYTFGDALNSRFDSKGIQLAAGISTLVVSIFYLIPQMVGAGALIQPLLGFPHWLGVLIVGTVVILIVVTAGMVSTTYVQFLKGSLLVIFSAILTAMILQRGLEKKSEDQYQFRTIPAVNKEDIPHNLSNLIEFQDGKILEESNSWTNDKYIRFQKHGSEKIEVWRADPLNSSQVKLRETQTFTKTKDGKLLVNGEPTELKAGDPELLPIGYVSKLPQELEQEGEVTSGPLGPISFFSTLKESTILLWKSDTLKHEDGASTKIYYPVPTPGHQVLRPGEHPKFKGVRSDHFWPDKLNFLSLMLALFCGTASLPHILIRYYTVKDEASARKSTIVGIGTIGFFYILTLYIGLGAMTSGSLDVTNSNMAAPLLAKSINEWLFAVISAIAFTTVLGTVSGLIIASSGAVVHDLMANFSKADMNDHDMVRIAKIASITVGVIAILLGILFKEMNVSYLVGWAFSIAASANLPALVTLLFWKKTTKHGIIAGILMGMISSLGWILLSGDTFKQVYGITDSPGIVPFSQPGIVTIPLGFITLIVVSLLTQPKQNAESAVS